ncbi:MAG: prepilin peptidase [Oscillospiraceae bacterium]|nr:prepilin peptidase [Oscillospiraceae bacterium]
MFGLELAVLAVLGLCVGSFSNVLIYRIPAGEEFVRTPSHCMKCGHRLRWYEMIPLVSWLIQRGRCRSCGGPVSPQYPVVEAATADAWVVTALMFPDDVLQTALCCALFTLLLVLAVIDWRTFEIPNGLSLGIFILGLVRLAADIGGWRTYVIGMLCVSVPFLLFYIASRGSAIGMGDIKLMAAAGLLLGWPQTLLAVIIGSVGGSVIHIARMKICHASHKLALGPYLAAGVWLSAVFGERLIAWYLSLFGL